MGEIAHLGLYISLRLHVKQRLPETFCSVVTCDHPSLAGAGKQQRDPVPAGELTRPRLHTCVPHTWPTLSIRRRFAVLAHQLSDYLALYVRITRWIVATGQRAPVLRAIYFVRDAAAVHLF